MERSFSDFNENTINTGFEPHYLYHPAWAARRLKIITRLFIMI